MGIPIYKQTACYWTWPNRNSGFTQLYSMVDLSSSLWESLPGLGFPIDGNLQADGAPDGRSFLEKWSLGPWEVHDRGPLRGLLKMLEITCLKSLWWKTGVYNGIYNYIYISVYGSYKLLEDGWINKINHNKPTYSSYLLVISYNV